jgi:hypothetical protein
MLVEWEVRAAKYLNQRVQTGFSSADKYAGRHLPQDVSSHTLGNLNNYPKKGVGSGPSQGVKESRQAR